MSREVHTASALQFEHWTSASLEQLDKTLRLEADRATTRISVRRLSESSNDVQMLTHRSTDGIAEWHGTEADIFFIQSGSATLIVGGELLNSETIALNEKRGGTIQGGERLILQAGDVVRIAPQTPHQMILEGSSGLTYFAIKVRGFSEEVP